MSGGRWWGRGRPAKELPVPAEVSRVTPGLGAPQSVSAFWGPAKPVLLVGQVAQREYWARRVQEAAGPGWAVAEVNAGVGQGQSALQQEAQKVSRPGKSLAERGRRARWQVTDRSKFTVDFSVLGLLKDGMVSAELFTGPKYPDQPVVEILVGAAAAAQKKNGRGLFLRIDNADAAPAAETKELLTAAVIAKKSSGEALTILVTADLQKLGRKSQFREDFLREFNVQTAPLISQQESQVVLTQEIAAHLHWAPAALAEAEQFAEGKIEPLQSLITELNDRHPPGFITPDSLKESQEVLVRDEVFGIQQSKEELTDEHRTYLTAVLNDCDARGVHSAHEVEKALKNHSPEISWLKTRNELVSRGVLVPTHQGSQVPRDQQGLAYTRAAVKELIGYQSAANDPQPTPEQSIELARQAVRSSSPGHLPVASRAESAAPQPEAEPQLPARSAGIAR